MSCLLSPVQEAEISKRRREEAQLLQEAAGNDFPKDIRIIVRRDREWLDLLVSSKTHLLCLQIARH